jgi:hypothetical protein
MEQPTSWTKNKRHTIQSGMATASADESFSNRTTAEEGARRPTSGGALASAWPYYRAERCVANWVVDRSYF